MWNPDSFILRISIWVISVLHCASKWLNLTQGNFFWSKSSEMPTNITNSNTPLDSGKRGLDFLRAPLLPRRLLSDSKHTHILSAKCSDLFPSNQQCVNLLSATGVLSGPRTIKIRHKALWCIRWNLSDITLQEYNEPNFFWISTIERAPCSLTTFFPLTEYPCMTASWMLLLLGAGMESWRWDSCFFPWAIACVRKLNLGATQSMLSLIFLKQGQCNPQINTVAELKLMSGRRTIIIYVVHWITL